MWCLSHKSPDGLWRAEHIFIGHILFSVLVRWRIIGEFENSISKLQRVYNLIELTSLASKPR